MLNLPARAYRTRGLASVVAVTTTFVTLSYDRANAVIIQPQGGTIFLTQDGTTVAATALQISSGERIIVPLDNPVKLASGSSVNVFIQPIEVTATNVI